VYLIKSGEMEGRKKESNCLDRPRILFIGQRLIPYTKRKGFGMKMGLLVEGYVDLK